MDMLVKQKERINIEAPYRKNFEILSAIKGELEITRDKNGFSTLFNKLKQRVGSILIGETEKCDATFEQEITDFCERISNILGKIGAINGMCDVARLARHDLINTMNGSSIFLLEGIFEKETPQNNWKEYECYLKAVGVSLSFMVYLYFYTLKKPIQSEAFYAAHAEKILVNDIINDVIFEKQKPNLQIINLLPSNIYINGVKGDFHMYVRNIVTNAKKRGYADMLEISIQIIGEKKYLCIADNGVGIQYKNPNDIFEAGSTLAKNNGGQGIGCSDNEKRHLYFEASHDGLYSKYTEENLAELREKGFEGEIRKKGAMIMLPIEP